MSAVEASPGDGAAVAGLGEPGLTEIQAVAEHAAAAQTFEAQVPVQAELWPAVFQGVVEGPGSIVGDQAQLAGSVVAGGQGRRKAYRGRYRDGNCGQWRRHGAWCWRWGRGRCRGGLGSGLRHRRRHGCWIGLGRLYRSWRRLWCRRGRRCGSWIGARRGHRQGGRSRCRLRRWRGRLGWIRGRARRRRRHRLGRWGRSRCRCGLWRGHGSWTRYGGLGCRNGRRRRLGRRGWTRGRRRRGFRYWLGLGRTRTDGLRRRGQVRLDRHDGRHEGGRRRLWRRQRDGSRHDRGRRRGQVRCGSDRGGGHRCRWRVRRNRHCRCVRGCGSSRRDGLDGCYWDDGGDRRGRCRLGGRRRCACRCRFRSGRGRDRADRLGRCGRDGIRLDGRRCGRSRCRRRGRRGRRRVGRRLHRGGRWCRCWRRTGCRLLCWRRCRICRGCRSGSRCRCGGVWLGARRLLG